MNKLRRATINATRAVTLITTHHEPKLPSFHSLGSCVSSSMLSLVEGLYAYTMRPCSVITEPAGYLELLDREMKDSPEECRWHESAIFDWRQPVEDH